MNKEQKFYSILKDLFVGAKLEGESGYVNLMNVKTDYFKKIQERIKKEVKAKFGEDQPEDLFDKLYTFFDSYFSDGGAIFFSSTPVYKNIYAKVYSDREDTALFWKTAKLYYVKSEANYKSIENLSIDSDPEIAFDFAFDATLLKHKQANEKKELEFYFIGTQKRGGKKIIKFRVLYKNDNKYTKLQEILKIKDKAKIIKYLIGNIEKLKNPKIVLSNSGLDFAKLSDKGARDKAKVEFIVSDNKDLTGSVSIEPAISETGEMEKYLKLKGVNLSSEEIEKAFRIYKKQTEIDYFIHKDAKGFLREQFDLYMYQHLAGSMDTVFSQESLDRIKKIKDIAHLTIDFIGNFEDELKKIWLKPKFARNSNYVLTLDRIADKKGGTEVIAKILKFKGFNNQFAEWLELGIVDKKFNPKEIIKNDKLSKDWQFLPIDTKHFKDLEIEIVGLFDNLDEALDGRLIKSDNFQALNTLLPKYREQVQTIYIDPPFNLGENADFDYLVNYKDSTWATLLENRSTLSYELLTKSGGIFVRCDYNGNWIIRPILDSAFQKNYRNEIIVSKSAKLTEQINKYHSGHDSLYFFTKSNNYDFQTTTRKRLDPKWRGMHLPGIRWSPISNQYLNLFSKKNILEKKGNFYTRARIILGKELLPPEGRHWALNQDSVFNLEKENKIKWGDNGEPQTQESEEQRLTDNWTDWVGYSSIWGFTTENHEKIIERSIRTSSLKEKEIILDFFLGSGTTTAVAHKLMKKWIGVEVGEQFENKILHRMKEVLAGRGHHEPTGISKEINWQGGGFFKYYELEQYEDVLKRANYSPTEKELQKIDFNFSTLENGAKAERKKQIEDSFSLSEKLADKGLEVDLKKEKARFVFEKLYPDVDIAETISNLFGKKIKKIGKDKVIFEDDSEVDLNNLDFTRYASLKKLIYW